MLHLLFAAAVSTAPPKPLFVPPKGMKRVAEDTWARDHIRGSRDARFVAEYRGTISFKPDWASVTYTIPERIEIVTHPTTVNAQEWGIQTITRLSSVHVPPRVVKMCTRNSTFAQYLTLGDASDVSEYVTPEQDALDQIDATKAAEKDLRVQANHAVKLCSGTDGWFSQFTATDAQGERYTAETMYTYGKDTSYLLRYVRAATQPEDSQARKALFSLCPPQSPTP